MLKAICRALVVCLPKLSGTDAGPPAAWQDETPGSPSGAPPGSMRISQRGVDLVKGFEGLRLKAYYCAAGVRTIGYGSTGPHVTEGLVISEAEAEALLRKDLARFEAAVNRLAAPCTQGQFDALTSFAFNCGVGALEKSTLLKRHKGGAFEAAGAEFVKWNKGGGRVLPGLTRRRAQERALYLGGRKR